MTDYLTIFCPITGHKSCCSAVLIWSVIRKIVPIFSNEYIFYWFCTNIFPILFLYFCSRNSYIPIYLKPVIAWRPVTTLWQRLNEMTTQMDKSKRSANAEDFLTEMVVWVQMVNESSFKIIFQSRVIKSLWFCRNIAKINVSWEWK